MQILANFICIPSQGTSPYTAVGLYWTYYLSHQLQEKWKEDKEQLEGVAVISIDIFTPE